jgi:hypothetical protein
MSSFHNVIQPFDDAGHAPVNDGLFSKRFQPVANDRLACLLARPLRIAQYQPVRRLPPHTRDGRVELLLILPFFRDEEKRIRSAMGERYEKQKNLRTIPRLLI